MYTVKVDYTNLEGGVRHRLKTTPLNVPEAVPEESSNNKEDMELQETYGRSDEDVKRVNHFVQQQNDNMPLHVCLSAMTRAVYSYLFAGSLPTPTDPIFIKLKGHKLVQLFQKNWKMPYSWMSPTEGWVFQIALIYKTLREFEKATSSLPWWWPFNLSTVTPIESAVPQQPLLDVLVRTDKDYTDDVIVFALSGVDISAVFNVSLVSVIFIRNVKKIQHSIKEVLGNKCVGLSSDTFRLYSEKWMKIRTESELVAELKREKLHDVFIASKMNPREFLHLIHALIDYYIAVCQHPPS